MPFVRTKVVRGIAYYYLVESCREGNKVRQRVLLYLGKHSTVRAAYTYWRKQLKAAKDAEHKKHAREMVKKLEEYL
jgi:hypothetical protein